MFLSVFAHISDYIPVCLVSHTSCSFEPFLFSCLNANSSSEWTTCRISHTPLIWLTVSVLLPNRKQLILLKRMPSITHTLIWLTVYFVLPNHKQFIRVNRMLYIAHTFIWLPVSFVPPHRKQLIKLNCMPYIAHATKIWTVFDASVIANILHLFWRFFTPLFAIIASHTVSSKGLWS